MMLLSRTRRDSRIAPVTERETSMKKHVAIAGVICSVVLLAGVVWAKGRPHPNIDEALFEVRKAQTAISAAEQNNELLPVAKNGRAAKALQLLEQAQKELEGARVAADNLKYE
jgi:hypothetical protein